MAVDNADLKALSFKLRIESERINPRGETVQVFHRTFKDFVDALDTARTRLAR